MSTVEILIGGIDYEPLIHFPTCSFESRVNGQPGVARIRVRDDDRTLSFTPGAPILLRIDGGNVWRGFVGQAKRVYIAPALNIPEFGLTRWIDIEGVDKNILFTKRIVFNQSSPANVYGTLYGPNTADTTALADLFSDFLDLTGDGLNTSALIENVGNINVDQDARAWSGGYQWGQAMSSINSLPNAVWYIDPDDNVVWTDVDTPTAPYGLSDQPNGTTTRGYREMEILKDGTALANDVLAWGMGYGSQTPVFVREIASASVTTHGLWQRGEVRPGIWKQATINRVADSIVNGSPESKRGSKNDRVSVDLVTYEPGFLPAHKVAFASNVFGFSDVIPIRKMTTTFEAPDSPRYRLFLSHEIDPPWSFIDPFFLGLPGTPKPPEPPKPPVLGPPKRICGLCGITDTYTRVSATSWGTCDAGLVYADGAGSTGSVSTNGSYGSMVTPVGVSGATSRILTVPLPSPIEAEVTFRTDKIGSDMTTPPPPPGNALDQFTAAGITVRNLDATRAGSVSIYFEKDRAATVTTSLRFFRQDPSTIEDITCPITINRDTWYHLKLRIEASVVLKAKVWADGDSEPVSWIDSTLVSPILTSYDTISLGAGGPEEVFSGGATSFTTDFENFDVAGVNRCTIQFDDFNRIVASGWGYVWTVTKFDGASSSSVDGVAGILDAVAGDIMRATTDVDAAGPWSVDSTATVRFRFSVVPTEELPTGFYIRSASSARSGIDVVISSVGGYFGWSLTNDVIVKLDWQANEWYVAQWRRTGTTLETRLWLDGDAVPDWQTSSTVNPEYGDRLQVYMDAVVDAEIQVDDIEFDDGSSDDCVDLMVGFPYGEAIVASGTTYTTLTNYVPGSLRVMVNGLIQRPGVDYEETDPATGGFTLLFTPAVTDTLFVVYMVGP